MQYRKACSFFGVRAARSSLVAALAVSCLAGSQIARSDDDDGHLFPGNLLVSRSVYDNKASNVVAGTTLLPPNCVGSACAVATADGTYPTVFNNDLVDASFGITSKIFLDELTPTGSLLNSLEVPNSTDNGVP